MATARNVRAHTRGTQMEQGNARRASQVEIGDFLDLACRAVMGGVAAALAFATIALLLSFAANARTVGINDPKTGELLLRTGTAGQYDVAPKLETEVAIQVSGLVARTRVTQVFHNPGGEYVEGIYVFPLPEKAAVDHLKMQIGERLIEGRIQEKEEARRTYEKAKSEGRKAALVEQQRPNLFTNSVAHIGPDEMVRITIEYQQALAYENGEYRLRFPLAVTPRYVPRLAAAAREGMPDEGKAVEAALALQPAYAPPNCGAVNPVDIAVTIDAGVPLGRVESSYHDAWIEKQAGQRVMVSLQKEQEEADRDFELVWSVAAGAAPQAALFTEGVAGATYGLLMVVPPQPSAAEKATLDRFARETILIVDTSGSMAGTSIEQAKAAVVYALETFTPRDRFNIVEFNSIMRPLFPDAMPASAENVKHARAWVQALRAGGGTEMAPALRFALNGREPNGALRQVIFMTDGGVGNEDELFRLIAERLGASRLFTIGIGSAPNSHFMTKAAQFGRGTFTYIGDVREVEEKMAKLFAKIEAPVLKDVAIRWADGTPLETFPPRVPDLYLGEPIVVSAAFSRTAASTVIVSGLRGNQPWSVALTPSADSDASGVGALWARAKIATLMDELRTGGDAAEVRKAVVQVALEHHLVSAYTSLVAVDVTPANATGSLRTALLKANLPRGSEMAGAIPQTDTAATLQFLLGLLALGSAFLAAVAAQRSRA
jgi:Ca-activated chloride channel family protein